MTQTTKTKLPVSITTEADVVQFLRHCTELIGGGFHPDTPFGDYLNLESTEAIFEDALADEYDGILSTCFDLCNAGGLDIYRLSLIEQAVWMGSPVEGRAVVSIQGIERSPHAMISAGQKGIVYFVRTHQVLVKMDEHIDGLELWDNCVAYDLSDSADQTIVTRFKADFQYV